MIFMLTYRYINVFKTYLKEITLASDKVSKGDFSVRLRSEHVGELGKLTHNFNYMVRTIKRNIVELEDKNVKLSAILKSISNAIIAIDTEENIMLMNQHATDFFDYQGKFEGKQLDRIVNDERWIGMIKDMILMRTNQKRVMHVDDKYYKLKVDPIRLEKDKNIIIGSIINIEDITEKTKLEKIRTDFVANVTHELKTPLTSINGFVETLRANEEIDTGTRDRFLGIISDESERLRRLIDDILMLSFIENRDSNVQKYNVPVYEVYSEVRVLLSDFILKKKINYMEDFERKDIVFNGNRDYLKQIFVNLIDNAIKYTPEGKDISVCVCQQEGFVEIVIEDSGIGIPSEDVDRIFERFYRVDKARSKKIGGTGLGLAIVKHIVMSCGGSIDVESTLNEGSRFIVKLPNR